MVYILFKDSKARLNRIAAFLLLSLAVWSFCDAFLHRTVSTADAMFWEDLSSLGWISFASFNLWFNVIFTGNEKLFKKWFIFPFFFALPVLLIYQQWHGFLISTFIRQAYGWSYTWSNSPWSYLFRIYYTTFLIIGLYLCHKFRKNTRTFYQKKQSETIFTATFISFILGSITNVLMTELHVFSIPPLAPMLTLIWGGGIVYAITKYKLMAITAAAAADEILSTMPDSLVLVNPDGTISTINQATTKLIGYQKDELIGKPVFMLFAEEDEQSGSSASSVVYDNFRELLLKGYVTNLEMQYLTKSKEKIPVHVAGSVIKHKQGETAAIVIIARDIREMKHLQEQILRQEQLATVGKAVSGVGHELRNPLASVKSIAFFLKRHLAGADSQTVYFLDLLEKEVESMNKIATDLLDFSRVKKPNKMPVLLEELLDDTLQSLTISSKVRIIKTISADVKKINVDPDRIKQVFINLITNSYEAMPNGGEICIKAERQAEMVKITFNDTGCGMNEEVLKRIFDPLFTTKRKGIGLGMAIVHDIIKQHEGKIEVASIPGKGSTFTIFLSPYHDTAVS